MDVDGSGEINYSEWALAAANKESLLTHKRLSQAFNMFDVDKSGFITADELFEVLDPLTSAKTSKSDWQNIIKDIDENGDGLISFQEFKSLMIELIMGTSDIVDHRNQLKQSTKEETNVEAAVNQMQPNEVYDSNLWPET